MITLYHVNHENLTDETRRCLYPWERDFADNAKLLFDRGGYVKVAEIDSDDLEYAFKATQNGVLSDSWSQEPPALVRPIEPCFHLLNGKRYGRKSTDIADILEVAGNLFMVDVFGFKQISKEG